MTQLALADDLMTTAVCRTDHPADAASALMTAAGEVLHAKFGVAGAINLLRSIIDDTEALMIAKHGRQPGEAIQCPPFGSFPAILRIRGAEAQTIPSYEIAKGGSSGT